MANGRWCLHPPYAISHQPSAMTALVTMSEHSNGSALEVDIRQTRGCDRFGVDVAAVRAGCFALAPRFVAVHPAVRRGEQRLVRIAVVREDRRADADGEGEHRSRPR